MAKTTRKVVDPTISPARGTIPTSLTVEPIAVSEVLIEGKNDRTRGQEFRDGILELAASMAAIGLNQPIIVSRIQPGAIDGRTFRLVAGERRLEAAKLLGWSTIPAVKLAGDAHEAEIRAAENLQRLELNADQIALVIGDLVADAEAAVAAEQGYTASTTLSSTGPAGMTAPTRDAIRIAAIKRVAERFGKPVRWVRDYAYIGGLPAGVRALAGQGRLALGHLRALAAVVDSKTCLELAKAYAAGEGPTGRPMGDLEELRHEINRTLNSLAGVHWDLGVPTGKLPACYSCPSNSRNRSGLFDGLERGTGADLAKATQEAGVCLNGACYRAKVDLCRAEIRTAGNRIGSAAARAKPKDRAALIGKQLQEANRAAPFVRPTVFREEVRERVEAKLAKPKAAGKAAAIPQKTPQTVARVAARQKFRGAIWTRNENLLEAWRTYARKLTPEQQAPLLLLFEYSKVRAIAGSESATPRKLPALAQVKAAINSILRGRTADAMGIIYTGWDPKTIDRMIDFSLREQPELVDLLAAEAGVDPLPPYPTLEEFLPKPAAKPPTKAAAAKPAAKPAGKKKRRKPQPSRSLDGPLPETEAAVLGSTDDRGRGDRAKLAQEAGR